MFEPTPRAAKAFARVCATAARTSAEYTLLQANDRVLAALSGGADSFVMLETLLALQKRAPFDFTVEAVTFDPAFPDLDTQKIADYCQSRQVPHTLVSLDMTALLENSPTERFRRPCVRCSRLRRGKLYGAARTRNCNKLALGHHADDLLESFIISLVRGQGLTTMGLNVAADSANETDKPLRIIRPLGLTPESLVKCAAGAFEFPYAGECPYKDELIRTGDRAWAKSELQRWQERIPDLQTLMLKSLGKVEAPWLLDKRFLDKS